MTFNFQSANIEPDRLYYWKDKHSDMKHSDSSKKTIPQVPRIPAVIVWLCSFASVTSLLLHLPGIISMKNATLFITLPASLIIVAIIYQHWNKQDAQSREFLLRLRLGFLGGLIGTIGYDLARIPFHYAGMNPLSPIQAYGMWVAGYSQANAFSHLLGFLYHLSNGITFGWIYSLIMIRRSWIWAVIWALLLETLAILSPFGSVFALRSYSGAVSLAYVAHLFYGIPLGLICQRQLIPSDLDSYRKVGWTLLFTSTFALTFWFVGDAHNWSRRPQNEPDAILITSSGISPAWSNYPLNTTIKLRNASESPVTVHSRRSGGSIDPDQHTIPPGSTIQVHLNHRGIYQFGIPKSNSRSIFLSVHEDGDYRLKPQ